MHIGFYAIKIPAEMLWLQRVSQVSMLNFGSQMSGQVVVKLGKIVFFNLVSYFSSVFHSEPGL